MARVKHLPVLFVPAAETGILSLVLPADIQIS
jgi:hypothetical protein